MSIAWITCTLLVLKIVQKLHVSLEIVGIVVIVYWI